MLARATFLALLLAPSLAFAQPRNAPAKQPESEEEELDPEVGRLLALVADVEKALPDRVQAAISLGRRHDPKSRPGLEAVLGDENPAIRAAVVRALGRIGDPAVLPALRPLRTDSAEPVRHAVDEAIEGLGGDPDAPVEWDEVRRVVKLGELTVPEDAARRPEKLRGTGVGTGLSPVAFTVSVRREVMRVAALYLQGEARPSRAVRREIRRHRLKTLRLDGSVSKVRYRSNEVGTCVFAEVALLLSGERDRSIRMTLSGSATAGAIGHAGRPIDVGALEERAVAEAIRGALHNLETE